MKESKTYETWEGPPSQDGRKFSQLIQKSGKTIATISCEEKNLVEIIAKAATAALNKAVGN